MWLISTYTRFLIICRRLHPFENGFSYLYQNISAVERKCLDCGDTLRGRSDKKFCSDQCRNNYNNKLNRDSNNFVRNVHGLLRKNRRILSDLVAEGKTVIHKDALYALGYNFSFFTHIVESKEGTKFQYCFDYGFSERDEEFVELRQSSSYPELLWGE